LTMLGRRIADIGDRVIGPAARRLYELGLRPLGVNACEVSAAVLFGYLVILQRPHVALAPLAANGLFDYLDGGLRRAAAQGLPGSQAAELRHAVADKLSDVAIFLATGWAGVAPWWLAIGACVASLAATAMGWLGEAKRRTSRGSALFDRGDRMLVFTACAALGAFAVADACSLTLSLAVVGQRACSYWISARPQAPLS
jgi:phosphatidylglycerophosphate synthase